MLQAKKILVVEDERDLCELLRDEAVFMGLDCLSALSASEAYDIFVENYKEIQGIVSDIRMPRESGIDFIKKILLNFEIVPPFIFLTGHAEEEIEYLYDLGACGVFFKPSEIGHAFEKIISCMRPFSERYVLETKITKIDYKFEDLELSSIGKGGFFLPLEASFPKIGQAIRFSAKTNSGRHIAGTGICRWVRRNQSPKGIGIEFASFDENSHLEFGQYLLEAKPQSYIPLK